MQGHGLVVAFLVLGSIGGDDVVAAFTNDVVRTIVSSSYRTRLHSNTFGEDSSGQAPLFPYSDDAVRFAYDEWRFMFDKGGFDEVRYQNFKNNYESVTVANIKARDAAFAAGRDPPAWRSLNEFGDLSLKEYEAYKRDGTLPSPTLTQSPPMTDSPSSPPPSLQPTTRERSEPTQTTSIDQATPIQTTAADQTTSTQMTTNDQPAPMETSDALTMNGSTSTDKDVGGLDTQAPTSDVECREAYTEWCKQFGRQPDPMRFATFSTNYLAMTEYTNRTGRYLTLNEFADSTQEEFDHRGNAEAAAQVKDLRVSIEGDTQASSGVSYGGLGSSIGEYQDQYGRTIRTTQSTPSAPPAFTGSPSDEYVKAYDPKINPPRVPQIPQKAREESNMVQSSAADQERGTNPKDDVSAVSATQASQPLSESNLPSSKPLLEDEPAEAIPSQTTAESEVAESPDESVSSTLQVIQQAAEAVASASESIQAAGGDVESTRQTQDVTDQSIPPTEADISIRPTVVIKRAEDPSIRQTEVAKRANDSVMLPSEVIKRAAESRLRRTELVDDVAAAAAASRSNLPDGVRATVVVKRNTANNLAGADGARATILIPRKSKRGGIFDFPFFNNEDGSSEDDPRFDVTGRSTIVVKRRIPDPGPDSILAKFSTKAKLPPIPGETGAAFGGKSSKETLPTPASSILSLFGGTRRSTVNLTPVRGRILIQNRPSSVYSPSDNVKKTMLVDNQEPIFSFFGGAKKKQGNQAASRPTIAIGKKEDNWLSVFSFLGFGKNSKDAEQIEEPMNSSNIKGKPNYLKTAQLAKAKARANEAQEARRLKEMEMNEKRLAARKKLEEVRLRGKEHRLGRAGLASTKSDADRKAETTKSIAAPRQPPPRRKKLPKLRRWRQNEDGSITGLIYESKSFRPGTKVTTSPVPLGATTNKIVRTESGSEYLLM